MISQVASFVSRAIHGGNSITEGIEPWSESSSSDITTECHELYNSLETWADPRDNIPRRAHTGNLVYQKAAQVCIASFRMEPDHMAFPVDSSPAWRSSGCSDRSIGPVLLRRDPDPVFRVYIQ